MLITKLERQKKNHKRYNLYLDGEFYCGLYDDTLLKYGLASGDEVTEKQIGEIRGFDEYIYGKKISFDYLSYRIRTISEIKKRLKKAKLQQETIEKVIIHLKELKLVDDEAFARQLVAEKIKNKPAGKRMIEKKLYEMGIPKQVGESVLDELMDEETEKSLAAKVYDKLLPKLQGLDRQEARKKIFAKLASRGFNFDIINEIIREKTD
ncbi:MAG: RecX family transcriptional regulator [Ignavibacteria bacterium]|nr:RecX family transcriptional regulator [Ignavibacteria bacterium]